MCNYCGPIIELDGDSDVTEIKNGDIMIDGIDVLKYAWWLSSYYDKTNFTLDFCINTKYGDDVNEWKLPINFCPMCGQKLTKEES